MSRHTVLGWVLLSGEFGPGEYDHLVHNAFRKKDGSVRYPHIKVTRDKGYFTHRPVASLRIWGVLFLPAIAMIASLAHCTQKK